MENEIERLEKSVNGLSSMIKKIVEERGRELSSNHKKDRIKCKYCSDTFSSDGRYNQHKRDYHRIEKGIVEVGRSHERIEARHRWWNSLTYEQKQEHIRKLRENHIKYLESRKMLR